MSDARAMSPQSRIELVVLGCLSGPASLSDDEIGAGVGELALPDASPERAREAARVALVALRQRGLVDERNRELTKDGARLLRLAFGLSRRPNWTSFRQRYFPALVLGVEPAPKNQKRKVPVAVVKLLATQLGVGDMSSLNELCDALIAELLGTTAGTMTLARIRAHVLARRASVSPAGAAEDVAARIIARNQVASAEERPPAAPPPPAPRSSVVSPRATSIRAIPDAGPPAALPEHLLEVVREVLPEIGAEGRYGSEKVFVSALWHRIEDRGRQAELSLEHFKRWLVTANRNHWLTLARADVVGAMDPKQVRESEIQDLGATFHFVLDPARNPAAQQERSHVR